MSVVSLGFGPVKRNADGNFPNGQAEVSTNVSISRRKKPSKGSRATETPAVWDFSKKNVSLNLKKNQDPPHFES